ncbi:MAG: hydrogenase iron-sulfur subunit [Alphaproteobacteria bacterium]
MDAFKRVLRNLFMRVEGGLDHVFPSGWNPLCHTGALGFFFYWIVAVSGVYVYILFDTGTTAAYLSVEAMTNQHWYHAGVMRSLHRYASDGLALFMFVHIVREFAFDRLRGPRWFTWVTGVPIVWLVFICGISGYWMVWDKLAQYIAVTTTEWLDWLPIFGEPVARNFLSALALENRFFTLLMFLHIAVPLILLFVLWIHLQRMSRPKINPPRGLAIGTFVTLVALSLVRPALSQGPADLDMVPGTVGLDWYYLLFYPVLNQLPKGDTWALAGILSFMLAALPFLPPMKRAPVAKVSLGNCNGCTRCAADCPFNAIVMGPRTDGLPFDREAVVDPDLCVSCGICMGACPSSTPFRRTAPLVTGIDLPHFSLETLRDKLHAAATGLSAGPRIIVFGCDHGADVRRLGGAGVAAISLPCIAMLPPSMIDYALARGNFDGVFLTGCREGECFHRLGTEWMDQRLDGKRDPRLRARVPRERVARFWAGPVELRALGASVADFGARLSALTGQDQAAHRPQGPAAPAATGEEVPVDG